MRLASVPCRWGVLLLVLAALAARTLHLAVAPLRAPIDLWRAPEPAAAAPRAHSDTVELLCVPRGITRRRDPTGFCTWSSQEQRCPLGEASRAAVRRRVSAMQEFGEQQEVSGHVCTDEQPHTSAPNHDEFKVCDFTNLVLYGGVLHYVQAEAAAGEPVPQPRAYPQGFGASWTGGGAYQPIVVVSQRQAAESPPWLRATRGEVVPRAVVAPLLHANNAYHVIGEYLFTAWVLACRAFGTCATADRDLRVLFLLHQDTPGDPGRSWTLGGPMDAAWQLLTPQRPVGLFRPSTVGEQGVAMRVLHTAFGVGTHCRGLYWCHRERYDVAHAPHPPAVVAAYRAFLLASADLSPTSLAPRAPHTVLLVNRRSRSSRTILNFPELIAAVKFAAPHARIVAVDDLVGMSLRAQLELFHGATVAVAAHGAALGWLVALPRNATVVEIKMRGFRAIKGVQDIADMYHHGWAEEVGCASGLRYVPYAITQPEGLVWIPPESPPVLDWSGLPLFSGLTPEMRRELFEAKSCPDPERGGAERALWKRCQSWLIRGSQILVNASELAAVVAAAL